MQIIILKTKERNTTDFFKTALKNITITEERKFLLKHIAEKIAQEYQEKEQVNLNFICTHNSRRSQLGQVWGFFAAEYFELKNISSFSGGTEITAFFRNTVATLKNVGFSFDIVDFSHQNPKYLISFEGSKKSIIGFSKLYNYSDNDKPFIAITTCDSADENCPFIPEALARFHLPFVDPKHSDGKENQAETYLKTNQQIAGEVYLIFKKVKELLS